MSSRTPRRPRLSVDLPEPMIIGTKRTANRFFRGSVNDSVLAALTTFEWLVRQRRAGRRVVAVPADQLPSAYEEPVIPGLEDALRSSWTWLVEREHPWRRQLWIKGRRLTAGDLARTAEVEGWSAQRTADEYDLPLEAVEEAQRYLAANRDLVIAEERENALSADSVGLVQQR